MKQISVYCGIGSTGSCKPGEVKCGSRCVLQHFYGNIMLVCNNSDFGIPYGREDVFYILDYNKTSLLKVKQFLEKGCR